jgi:hypothetical protein
MIRHRPTPAVAETIAMAWQADTTGQRFVILKSMKKEGKNRFLLKISGEDRTGKNKLVYSFPFVLLPPFNHVTRD